MFIAGTVTGGIEVEGVDVSGMAGAENEGTAEEDKAAASEEPWSRKSLTAVSRTDDATVFSTPWRACVAAGSHPEITNPRNARHSKLFRIISTFRYTEPFCFLIPGH
jgi:hypothetical protein